MRRFYFHYPNLPAGPSPFWVNDLEITVSLTGNGFFDPVLNDNQFPIGSNGPKVQVLNPTTLYWRILCDGSAYQIPTGSELNKFFDAFVVVESGTVNITATVNARINQPQATGCNTVCNNIQGSSANFTQTNTCNNGVNDLVASFSSEPDFPLTNNTFISNNHAEVPVYLNITNTGSSGAVLQDIVLKLTIDDVHGTLPVIVDPENYFLEATMPTNAPVDELHNGNTHYFRFGSIEGGGTLLAGATLRILAFTIKPPEGLNNILGKANITLNTLRVLRLGGTCCNLTNAGCSVDFPGIPYCNGSPSVKFSLKPVTLANPPLLNCQSAFDLVAEVRDANNNPTSVNITAMKIDFETNQTSNLAIASFATPIPGATLTFTNTANPCGPDICQRSTGTFLYGGNSVALSDGATIRVVYQGNQGAQLQTIDIKSASITRTAPAGTCAPRVDEASASNFLPITNQCTYCQNNTTIALENSAIAQPPGCIAAISVRLTKAGAPNSTTGSPRWKSFKVKLTLLNPDNLSLSISNVSGATLNGNTCPPTVPPGGISSGSAYYVLGNTVYFSYCSNNPAGINLPNSFVLFDVSIFGTGCIDDALFEMETEVELVGEPFCHPLDATVMSPAQFCTPCQYITFSGQGQDENGHGIEIPKNPNVSGVFIDVESNATNCWMPALTGFGGGCDQVVPGDCDDGQFSFEINTANCMEGNEEVTVTPYKDSGPLDGVSTFDLVLISKHILGSELLDSPYKIIAADANNSKSVTTFDLVEIRKLILFINDNFPNNTSWRFVDAAFAFPNPNDPWASAFPDCIHFELDEPPFPALDFVAIKIGDVNNSHAYCSSFTGNQTTERFKSSIDMYYSANKLSMKTGDLIEVDFYLSGSADLSAWQAGLRFDPTHIEFMEALPSELPGMNIGNFGLTEAKDGKLRVLWYDEHGESLAFRGDAPSFSLRFRSRANLDDLAGLFSLDDKVLYGAAFEADGKANGLRMGHVANGSILPGQATKEPLKVTVFPNPFANEFKLVVDLKEADYVDVAVYDALGRLVAAWNEYAGPGRQEIIFNKTFRWGTGVFTWQVRAGKSVESGKIIKE
jgi:hypothetical protein